MTTAQKIIITLAISISIQYGSTPILSQSNAKLNIITPPTENKKISQQNELLSIVNSNTQFAISLFQIESQKTGNLILSPFSVAMTLSAIREGAATETYDELSYALLGPTYLDNKDIDNKEKSYSEELKLLNEILQHPNQSVSTSNTKSMVRIANSIWPENEIQLNPTYKITLKKVYDIESQSLDYKTNPKQAAETINKWIELKTNNKIKDMFSDNSFNDTTRLVIVNAIYFKGLWASPFKKDQTKRKTFYNSNNTQKEIPMMTQTLTAKYLDADQCQSVELPYDDGNYSLILYLPKEKKENGNATKKKLLPNFIENISSETLETLEKKMKPIEVKVTMPVIELSIKTNLKPTLKAMGIRSAFTQNQANFSKITSQPFHISDLVQKAYIKINEEGTEAAAATGATFSITSIKPPPKEMTLDRPFMFVIKENTTGVILFVGQYQQAE